MVKISIETPYRDGAKNGKGKKKIKFAWECEQ